MFDHPYSTARMLGIPVEYVHHFATILAVLSSKKALLSPEGFQAFCNGHLDEKFQNKKTKWNHHNVTVIIPFHTEDFSPSLVTFCPNPFGHVSCRSMRHTYMAV